MRVRTALLVAAVSVVVTSGCLGVPSAGNETSAASPTDGDPATGTPTPTDPSATTPGAGTGTATDDGTDGKTETPTSTETMPGTAVADYESHVFDHAGLGSPVIDGGLRHDHDSAGEAQFYVTTVSSTADAERFDHSLLSADASAFVNGTSFEDASLVVIQTFPASSHPDYRVESVRRTDGGLYVAINDSSFGGTSDITVETVLLRVPGSAPDDVTVTTEDGRTFDTSTGVTTVTPEPTPTPEPEIALPYTGDDESENLAEPLDLAVVNDGNETNGFSASVVYHDRPDCLDATPPCELPTRAVDVLDRSGKLQPGADLVVTDAVARTGNYTVTVHAELPDGDGSRERVSESVTWTVDESAGDLVATITDDGVSVRTGTA